MQIIIVIVVMLIKIQQLVSEPIHLILGFFGFRNKPILKTHFRAKFFEHFLAIFFGHIFRAFGC